MPPRRRVTAPSSQRTALHILYVYSRDSTFVTIDRELLARRATVTNWPQPRPWVNVFALARQVRGSDLVVGWFASWHTFWPVLRPRLSGPPPVRVVGESDSPRLHGGAPEQAG